MRLPREPRAQLLLRLHIAHVLQVCSRHTARHDAGASPRTPMFPWQSGSDGTEETQIVHLNPLSGEWDPDLSHNQRH